MRNIVMALTAGVLLAGTAQAQTKTEEANRDNGNKVTKTFPVSSFQTLKASGVFELKLSQGDTEGVKVEAPENLLPYYTVRTEGQELRIEMKDVKMKDWKPQGKVRVFVQFKSLTAMALDIVGSVQSETPLRFTALALDNHSVGNVKLQLSATDLVVKNNSVGNVALSGTADNATIKHKGVGNFDADALLVQTLNIDSDGVGSARVNAAKELTVSDNFLGRVQNKCTASPRRLKKADL